MDEFIIDIEDYLDKFNGYLDHTNRAILSAKFGEGKTYFLKKFITNSKFKDKYEFITLYPINYQVQDNKDIFELIKRDILIQMIAKGMIPETYEIPKHLVLQEFLMNNSNIVLDIISSIQYLNIDPDITSGFYNAFKAFKWVKNVLSEYQSYKSEKKESSIEKIINDFMEECTKKTASPVEFDTITEIITKNIISYKDDVRKNIVLVVEDLDRLDPAHLFRILNVLSAQIDQPPLVGQPIQDTYNLIKFGFDKILLVCDYDNVNNIFHHFYGPNSNFDGYIRKFIQGSPFNYSLFDVSIDCFATQIQKITKIKPTITRFLLSHLSDHSYINTRRLKDVLENIEEQIKPHRIPIVDAIYISPNHNKTLQYFVIMKRLFEAEKKYELENLDFEKLEIDVFELFDVFILFGLKRKNSSGYCYLHNSKYDTYQRVDFQIALNGNLMYTGQKSYSYITEAERLNSLIDYHKIVNTIMSFLK